MSISNTQDVIDSREINDRIEELKAEFTENTEGDNPDDYAMTEEDWSVGLGDDGAHEIVTLLELAEEAKNSGVVDWEYGETLIHTDYFIEYAEQLSDDLGLIDREMRWPLNHIDWEAAADELMVDYTELDFDGQVYYARMG